MDFQALADFILVAENGGFAPAARQSGQSKATLSRRVRELEENLGIRLFDRDSRALRLTDEGESLFARTRGPMNDVAEAELALRAAGDTPRGLLRVSAPVLFSELALGALAASYLRKCPEVQLDLLAENRIASVVEDRLDIIIRVNPAPREELVGRCFLRERHQMVAVPALVEKAEGVPDFVWPSVIISGRTDRSWTASSEAGERIIRHEPVIRVSSMLTSYHAALAGAGVVKLPWFMVARDVAAGRLVRLGEDAQSNVEIWALHLSRRLASLKITSFLDHLRESFPGGRWPSDPTFAPIPALSANPT